MIEGHEADRDEGYVMRDIKPPELYEAIPRPQRPVPECFKTLVRGDELGGATLENINTYIGQFADDGYECHNDKIFNGVMYMLHRLSSASMMKPDFRKTRDAVIDRQDLTNLKAVLEYQDQKALDFIIDDASADIDLLGDEPCKKVISVYDRYKKEANSQCGEGFFRIVLNDTGVIDDLNKVIAVRSKHYGPLPEYKGNDFPEASQAAYQMVFALSVYPGLRQQLNEKLSEGQYPALGMEFAKNYAFVESVSANEIAQLAAEKGVPLDDDAASRGDKEAALH